MVNKKNKNDAKNSLFIIYNKMEKSSTQIKPLVIKKPVSETADDDIQQYLSELSEIHKDAVKIAEDHLGSSFDIIKSNGFKAWLARKKESSSSS